MEVKDSKHLPNIHASDIVIDALFGIGLSKSLEGLAADCVKEINESNAKVISIDVPSGLFVDKHSEASSFIIKAFDTLTFQFPKLAFLFSEKVRR